MCPHPNISGSKERQREGFQDPAATGSRGECGEPAVEFWPSRSCSVPEVGGVGAALSGARSRCGPSPPQLLASQGWRAPWVPQPQQPSSLRSWQYRVASPTPLQLPPALALLSQGMGAWGSNFGSPHMSAEDISDIDQTFVCMHFSAWSRICSTFLVKCAKIYHYGVNVFLQFWQLLFHPFLGQVGFICPRESSKSLVSSSEESFSQLFVIY